ncbi:MAG: lipocalin family protein, partial [Steroidobacteraceae bacterium]|nr:lipocalin family protein [Steroidobacteraceae bacterium]MCC7199579.1 lipocalin family protein [Gammaproteobacteria bacterium]
MTSNTSSRASKLRRVASRLAVLAGVAVLVACQSAPTMPVVDKVDLPRFMGPWYVLACIPTYLERDAYNAVESYALQPDGTIATTFTFNKGSLDGERKVMTPHGFVVPGTNNAVWGMQFVWPIKAEYLIAHVDANYAETIIGRSKRDYVWIMARTPALPEADYERLVAKVASLGYDMSKLQRIQHSPVAAPAAASAAPKVSGEALAQRMAAQDATLFVLDVRTPDEFAAGHVPGAVNVPHDQVESRL